jgi:hypothetical protein
MSPMQNITSTTRECLSPSKILKKGTPLHITKGRNLSPSFKLPHPSLIPPQNKIVGSMKPQGSHMPQITQSQLYFMHSPYSQSY